MRVIEVIIHVKNHYKLSNNDFFLNSSHARRYTLPRQVSAYVARIVTGKSWGIISKYLRRDRSTLFYSFKKIAHMRNINPELDAEILVLLKEIRNMHNQNGTEQ